MLVSIGTGLLAVVGAFGAPASDLERAQPAHRWALRPCAHVLIAQAPDDARRLRAARSVVGLGPADGRAGVHHGIPNRERPIARRFEHERHHPPGSSSSAANTLPAAHAVVHLPEPVCAALRQRAGAAGAHAWSPPPEIRTQPPTEIRTPRRSPNALQPRREAPGRPGEARKPFGEAPGASGPPDRPGPIRRPSGSAVEIPEASGRPPKSSSAMPGGSGVNPRSSRDASRVSGDGASRPPRAASRVSGRATRGSDKARRPSHGSSRAAPRSSRVAPRSSRHTPRSSGAVRRLPGEIAVAAALGRLGTPYSWGGGAASGPTRGIAHGARTIGFDCSGLTLYAWAKAGVRLGHYTGAQFRQGRRIPVSALRPGDLVFFGGGSDGPGHVGLYVGGGTMVHAPKTGDVVKKTRFLSSDYYMSRYRGAVRPGT
jgi:cell wall-associated NlpC family hydrolase